MKSFRAFVYAVLPVAHGFMAGFFLHSAMLIDKPVTYVTAGMWGLASLLWVVAAVAHGRTIYYAGKLDAYRIQREVASL